MSACHLIGWLQHILKSEQKHKMPQQKAHPYEDEMEKIRESLNLLLEELSKVANQQARELGPVKEAHKAKSLFKEQSMKISYLQCHFEDLEQYSCLDDLILSGLELQSE